MNDTRETEIILNGVKVNGCKYLYNSEAGLICNLCDLYNLCSSCVVRCADNPDCYYKQLQRIKAEYKKFSEYLPIANRLAKQFKTFEKTKGIDYGGILSEWIEENKKLKNTLKEIAEIAKTKIYTPACFEDPDCPKNGGVGFDNQCDEYCPILTIGKILEKIKEIKNAD